ncbi:MAG: CSLREA domain-containing protein, partial [Deltaproteobacteria bacterium]|nr:CSLREA domain-containing protein [Deltaproteobacteria bacterium]
MAKIILAFALTFLSLFYKSPAQAATIYVETTADEYNTTGTGNRCSLREAIQAANTDTAFGGCTTGSGGDIIQLASATYTLTRPRVGVGENANIDGDLDIRTNMEIRGDARTVIDGISISDRLFHILP